MDAQTETGTGEQTAAFGASWDSDPRGACAVLRAHASTMVPLRPVAPVDAAAAVVAAHAWAHITGESSLTGAHRHDAGARAAAAALLARAAGHARTPPAGDLFADLEEIDPQPCPPSVAAALSVALAWVEVRCPEPVEVLAAAAVDLLAAGTGPLAGAGWLLLAEAEARAGSTS